MTEAGQLAMGGAGSGLCAILAGNSAAGGGEIELDDCEAAAETGDGLTASREHAKADAARARANAAYGIAAAGAAATVVGVVFTVPLFNSERKR